MRIRRAEDRDFEAIWPIFQAVVSKADSYAFDPEIRKEEAFAVWMRLPAATYVAEVAGKIMGSYYLKANQALLGAHVCNAGYMVAEEARGKGLGKAMCLDSQREALKLGFKAMQFNLVVSTNPALRLWEQLGFATVGRLPKAFKHPDLGYVDALVMYKWLEP